MLLSRLDFSSLSPERGTFRGFLKTAARRYLATVERRAYRRQRLEALRQGLGQTPDSETQSAHRPDEAFERAWAESVLSRAVNQLRNELRQENKELYFQLFEQYCLREDAEVSYRKLAEQHGLRMDDVRNHLHAVRVRGRAIVRQMIGDYLFPQENVEDELRFILSR